MTTPFIFGIENSLGPLEFEIIGLVWKKEKTNVRAILEELKLRRERQVAYTTVMTVMDNLYKKGFLTRQKIGKTFYYSPIASEKYFINESISKSLIEINKNYGTLRIIFALVSVGFYGIPIVYLLSKFSRNLNIVAGGYALSFTIFFSLSVFSIWDLIQNLNFFGTLDYIKFLLIQPKEIFANFNIFVNALFESFPIINFSVTLVSFLVVIFLAKKLSKILNMEVTFFNMEFSK